MTLGFDKKMKTRLLKKPSLSICLIIVGSVLLFIFSVVFRLIDVRLIPYNDVIPMIILFSGWSMLGIGIAKRLYPRIMLKKESRN